MNKPTDNKRSNEVPAVSLADAMISNMNELALVLNQELALIEKQDVTGIQELMRQKNRMVMNYQANIKSITLQPDLLKQIPTDKRQKLKEVGTKLASVTERNALALKAASMATEKLLQNVMSLVRKEVVVKNGYSNPRTAHLELGVHSPSCPPVAVNRTA